MLYDFHMPYLRVTAAILLFGFAIRCIAAQEDVYPVIKLDELQEAEYQCFLLSELLSATAEFKSSGTDISVPKNNIKRILASKYQNLGLEMVGKVYSGDPITEKTRIDYFRRCVGKSVASERQFLVGSCYQAQREIDKFRLLRKQGTTQDKIANAISSSDLAEFEKKLFAIILGKIFRGEDTDLFRFKIATWAGCTSLVVPK